MKYLDITLPSGERIGIEPPIYFYSPGAEPYVPRFAQGDIIRNILNRNVEGVGDESGLVVLKPFSVLCWSDIRSDGTAEEKMRDSLAASAHYRDKSNNGAEAPVQNEE